MPDVGEILDLFARRGGSQYGGEAVSQLQHALQCAALAERAQATPELIVAALLHDIGHLLHELPDDAPDQGVDDHHENSGGSFLCDIFPNAVTVPIRLHVDAKRYLCAIDGCYRSQLSEPSQVSLELQGGPMTPEEVAEFELGPFARDAANLRRWDDAAKDPDCETPPISHFAEYLHKVAVDSSL